MKNEKMPVAKLSRQAFFMSLTLNLELNHQLPNCLTAFPLIFLRQLLMLSRTATLDSRNNLKAGIMAYLSHGTNSTARLIEPDIPRPRRGTGTEENTFLALHKRFWKARSITHHAINDTIEQQFHLSGDITPISRLTQDNGISIL